jgi:hypothetical protein
VQAFGTFLTRMRCRGPGCGLLGAIFEPVIIVLGEATKLLLSRCSAPRDGDGRAQAAYIANKSPARKGLVAVIS